MLTAPHAPARLPFDVSRCSPSADCPQRANCARANDWPDAIVPIVDASVCLEAGWCPMFIDMRGAELLKEAA
jgi:hypothetical protein